MILAETVSIDGGALLLGLLLLFGIVAAWIALVVFGCSLARRAGRGSQNALAGWAVVAFVEVAPLVSAWRTLLLVGLAAVALQVTLFLNAKHDNPGGGR